MASQLCQTTEQLTRIVAELYGVSIIGTVWVFEMRGTQRSLCYSRIVLLQSLPIRRQFRRRYLNLYGLSIFHWYPET
jgi:hypothetical protein